MTSYGHGQECHLSHVHCHKVSSYTITTLQGITLQTLKRAGESPEVQIQSAWMGPETGF